jgi:hypothetical protein
VAFVGDAQDQIENPFHFRASKVDGEKHDFEPLLVRESGRLNGKINGFLHRPFIRVLDNVLAGRHFHHDAGNAAIQRSLHVVDHAAGKGENLRAEVSLHDLLDRRFVAWRHHRHPGLNPVNPGFRQRLRDPDLVILCEDDAGLLFAVTQRDIVKFDLLREMELALNCFVEIPGTDKPFVCFPRLL